MIQYQLQLDDEGPELHAYSVRVSGRARSVSLRVLPDLGLEITVPRRFDQSAIPEIVRENREWIEQAVADIKSRGLDKREPWPPQQLHLAAINQQLNITFAELPEGSDKWRAEMQADQLVLMTPGSRADQRDMVARLVASLLKRKARQYLEPLTALHAEEQGMSYRRLSVRGQRTLWGSYSSSGTLSLNYKLLFLPPELVDYVVLHELAHTRHMDHSRAFWRLLDKMIPGARDLDDQVNDAATLVPRWLERA